MKFELDSKLAIFAFAVIILALAAACETEELSSPTAGPTANIVSPPTAMPTDPPVPSPLPQDDTETLLISKSFLLQPWEKYGGDEGVAGLYLLLDPENFGAFLELDPDGTCFLELGTAEFHGRWQADEDRIILNLTGSGRPVVVQTGLGADGVRWIGKPLP